MRMHWVMMGVVLGVTAGGALGQILPPAPPKTTPTPEYTPPPPPPTPPPVAPRTAPTTPSVPEGPLPSLVERDAKGVLKPLGMTAEEAAIRALKPSEETLKKVDSSLAARSADLDRLVVQNVEGLVDLRKFGNVVNEESSLDEITTNAKKAAPFKSFPGVLDRLSKEGAIDGQTKVRAAKVAKEYVDAAQADMMKGFEHGNTQQMVLMGFRRYLATTTAEAYEALDRQLLAAADQIDTLVDKINLPAEKRSGVLSRLRAAPKGSTPEAREQRLGVMWELFQDVLGPGEREALLRAASPAEKPAGDENK